MAKDQFVVRNIIKTFWILQILATFTWLHF